MDIKGSEIPDEGRCARQENRPFLSERLLNWANRWSVLLQVGIPSFFSGLVLIVISVQAFVYFGQWRVMERTLTESRISREIENAAIVGVDNVRLKAPLKVGEEPVALASYD